MLRLFANAKYDFISVRRYAYAITALFILPGLLLLLVRGLNYSIEFTGGTLIQVESKGKVDVAAVRAGLDREGIHGAEIQNFGAPSEFVVRARVAKPGTDANDTQATANAVHEALSTVLGADNFSILRTEAVGPKVGGELRTKAFLAIFLSFFAVLAYLYYYVAIVLAMGAAGFAIGSGIVVALGIGWNWVAVLVGLAVGLIVGLVSVFANVPMIMLVVIGSIAFAGCVMVLKY